MVEEIIGGENETFSENPEKNPREDIIGGEVMSIPEQEPSSEGASEQVETKLDTLLAKQSSSSVSGSTHDDGVVAMDAKSVDVMTDEESKIQMLLDLASTKGVVHAVKVARKLNDYYALDCMHDELVDKFYDGLLERGLIEKE
ncbi:MAG: hypothetical protein HYV45_00805 [Candidatus Moranbacteria bacterium]|nr:hypothetical protein [Candidatus Moranbacteria bacterium]